MKNGLTKKNIFLNIATRFENAEGIKQESNIHPARKEAELAILNRKRYIGAWRETNIMKKILIVLGGGRPKGNTKQLVDAFTRGAEDACHHQD